MNIMKLKEFREQFAGEKKPAMNTLKKWDGVFKQGGTLYIDLDVVKAKAAQNETQAVSSDDPEINNMLQATA